MKGKPYRVLKYLLLCILAGFLLPLSLQADIEEHIIETTSGFYYVVQKGDTLWDLSEKFSDSPWHWPELWRQNPEIANPHLIYPGQRIQVYKKAWEDRVEAPVAIKPPEADEYYRYSPINAVGFIRETEAPHHGTVIKVKYDMRLISTGDKIFIEPAENAEVLQEGFTYAIYRTSGPVHDPVSDEYVGIQHTITGTAEIVGVTERFAEAKIVSAFRDIREGDLVMPFRHRSDRIRMLDPVPGLSGRMIKAEDGEALIGEHTVAFINKGESDRVKPGQTYTLYYREATTAGLGANPIPLSEETLGKMMVLHTEETTSTVLITNSVDQIPDGTAFKP